MKPGQLEAAEASELQPPAQGLKKWMSILDFILRIVAAIGTLGSAIAMATTNETLRFFTQFIQFRAEYNDLPSFTFFVIANSLVCGYLVLSIPLSIFHIKRPALTITRIILIILDTAMMALLTAGGSAAAAIVYLAHNGNSSANWFAICQQFNSFCKRITGSLIGSFGATLALILLIILSAVVISRH
ncbi:casparian strip membrane protein 3-like [Rhodamnia argentea]|uniref:CASP-like protein n=1 Tax=Rhodamnia argentea TaxID=178133 RepID=A0A8B8QJM5_9MYRT|nr:casparian strip membrane protein 3-like [Rhodamnia argentea]